MMLLFPILIAFLFPNQINQDTWNKHKINGFTQGTTYNITYYSHGNSISRIQIDSIFNTIDQSLSIYQENSLISKFNKSKKGIEVDAHFINVVQRSIEINHKTMGLFDITLLQLMEAWGFTQKGIIPSEPSELVLQNIKSCMGTSLLQLKGNKIIKKKPCVKIDVNGIAQGYSVDVVAQFLLQHNITNFIIEIGGEIRVNGRRQPSGEKMAVGIQSPEKHDFMPQSIQKIIVLENGAITTSGNYQKFYESKGKKVSHLMNPKTAKPVSNDLISVTVYAKDAITADGYDNALMVLGLKKAMQFVQNNKEIEAYFIYKEANGKIKDTATVNFYKLIQ